MFKLLLDKIPTHVLQTTCLSKAFESINDYKTFKHLYLFIIFYLTNSIDDSPVIFWLSYVNLGYPFFGIYVTSIALIESGINLFLSKPPLFDVYPSLCILISSFQCGCSIDALVNIHCSSY